MGVMRAGGDEGLALSPRLAGGASPPCDGGPKGQGGCGAGSQSLPRGGCLPPLRWGAVDAAALKRGPSFRNPLYLFRHLSVPASRGVPPPTAMGALRARGDVGLALSPCLVGGASPPAMVVVRARGGRGAGSQSLPRGGCLPPTAMVVVRARGGRGAGSQSLPRGGCLPPLRWGS
nr:putative uncharacterized protein FLJ45355 [Gorilla gorilla gorilla]